MNKTFALEHPTQPPRDPHTLGTVALALATCPHPEKSQVRTAAASQAPSPVWCAACGALRLGGVASRWQMATLPSLLTRKRFEDLVVLLHGIRQLTLLARSQTSTRASPGSRDDAIFRSVRASLLELARLPIIQGLDRLEAALTEAAATFGRREEASR